MRARHLAAITFALFAVACAPWPGDWDAVSFVDAVARFDLASFSPHPPGYPVYVLASRAFALFAPDAVRACGLASALGGALVIASLTRVTPSRYALSLLALASPVLCLAATSPRSDALGLGFAALSLSSRSPWLAGVALSLSLGARPGYAVLVASIAAVRLSSFDRGARLRFVSIAAVIGALWGAWLVVASGGFARYADLTRAHVSGHFNEWGGSAVTRPETLVRLGDAAKALALALSIDASIAGVTRGLAWLALGVIGFRSCGRRERWALLAAVAPYALVAFWTQNLAGEPRHALPAALAWVALSMRGADALLARFRPSRPRRAVALTALLACMMAPSARVVWVQRTREPAAVALARAVNEGHAPRDVAIFGGRSARVMAWSRRRAFTAVYMGEVDVALSRFDRLPRVVFVTDEVRGTERARGSFGEVVTRCRDEAVDRASACVSARRYDVLRR